jgi:hypothetical protein
MKKLIFTLIALFSASAFADTSQSVYIKNNMNQNIYVDYTLWDCTHQSAPNWSCNNTNFYNVEINPQEIYTIQVDPSITHYTYAINKVQDQDKNTLFAIDKSYQDGAYITTYDKSANLAIISEIGNKAAINTQYYYN